MTTIDMADGVALSATDTSATAIATNANFPSDNGAGYLAPLVSVDIAGTWGGATATVQRKANGQSVWQSVGSDGTFTSDGSVIVRCGVGDQIRVNVAGGSGHSLKATMSEYLGAA